MGGSEPGSRKLLRQATATAALDISDMTMGLVGWQNAFHTWVGHRTYTMTARHWAWGQDTRLGPKTLRESTDKNIRQWPGQDCMEYRPDTIHVR